MKLELLSPLPSHSPFLSCKVFLFFPFLNWTAERNHTRWGPRKLAIFKILLCSETHQFRCRYVILWKVKILKKNCLKTSSETRLLSETGFLFSFGFRFAFFDYSGPLIFTTRLKHFEGSWRAGPFSFNKNWKLKSFVFNSCICDLSRFSVSNHVGEWGCGNKEGGTDLKKDSEKARS
jgi:hypothetical protein